MTNEEQNYVNELEKRILYLKQNLKLRTEEREKAVYLAVKYISKYVKYNDLTNEVEKGVKEIFEKINLK